MDDVRTMKGTWSIFKDHVEKALTKVLRSIINVKGMTHMSEEDLILTNESIRIYNESKDMIDCMTQIYDNNISDIKIRLEKIENQNDEIIRTLEFIKNDIFAIETKN